jgi:thioredoxin 1
MLVLNESNFDQEVLEASKTKPIIVDFFAEWCGGCKIMAPMLDELDEESGGAFGVFKVSVEESPALVEKYDVMSLPTIVLFKDGVKADSLTGAQSKESLLEFVKK